LLVPAGGAAVSNLQAEVNIAPGTGNSYTVDVLDNGTAIYSCTISGAATTCANTGAAVAVAAGHRLQVRITNAGASNHQFRVSFRY
jgi:hypothetical protein